VKEFENDPPDWIHEEDGEPKPISDKGKRWITVAMVFAVPFCMWAGWFEWGRAHQGNWRAWVYTFEWPFFGAIAIYIWRRLTKGDLPKIPRPNFEELAHEFEKKRQLDDGGNEKKDQE
jgi:hypothetical protein